MDPSPSDLPPPVLTLYPGSAYPIEHIDNAKIPCLSTSHPKNIILLTCDARGVLPPISKLTLEQTMFHFISGYTSKMAGTEDGVTEPQATFSSCFAQPFLALHPMRYARMLADKMSRHNADAWLLNTGWVGAGVTKGGKRCSCVASTPIFISWPPSTLQHLFRPPSLTSPNGAQAQVHPRHPRRHSLGGVGRGRVRDVRDLQPPRANVGQRRPVRAPKPGQILDRRSRGLQGRGQQARHALRRELQEVRG